MGAALLASCNNDKTVDTVYQFSAEVIMSDVIKNIKNIDGTAYYYNGEPQWISEEVAMMFNIYDQSGKLVSSDESTYPNFLARPTINKALQEGEYTIVAIAYFKEMEGTDQYWNFSNKDQLQNFKINDAGLVYTSNDSEFGFLGSVLGILKQTVSVARSQTYQLTIPPATSMLAINLDDLNLSGVKFVTVKIKTANDYYSVNEQQGHVISMLNRYDLELKKDDNYRNVIAYLNYFPTSNFDIIWEGYNAAGTKIKNGTVTSSALSTSLTKIITISTQTGVVSTVTKSITANGINTRFKSSSDKKTTIKIN